MKKVIFESLKFIKKCSFFLLAVIINAYNEGLNLYFQAQIFKKITFISFYSKEEQKGLH